MKANAKRLGDKLTELGYEMVTGGTDNHLLLWYEARHIAGTGLTRVSACAHNRNLRPKKITGSKMEKLFDFVKITANKNT